MPSRQPDTPAQHHAVRLEIRTGEMRVGAGIKRAQLRNQVLLARSHVVELGLRRRASRRGECFHRLIDGAIHAVGHGAGAKTAGMGGYAVRAHREPERLVTGAEIDDQILIDGEVGVGQPGVGVHMTGGMEVDHRIAAVRLPGDADRIEAAVVIGIDVRRGPRGADMDMDARLVVLDPVDSRSSSPIRRSCRMANAKSFPARNRLLMLAIAPAGSPVIPKGRAIADSAGLARLISEPLRNCLETGCGVASKAPASAPAIWRTTSACLAASAPGSGGFRWGIVRLVSSLMLPLKVTVSGITRITGNPRYATTSRGISDRYQRDGIRREMYPAHKRERTWFRDPPETRREWRL